MGGHRVRLVLAVVVAVFVSATVAATGRPAAAVTRAAATTSISTSAATEIGRNSATVHVTLSSTESGQWELDYGMSTAYGQSLGRTGFSPETATMTYQLQRLLPGTTYHVRAVAMTPSFPPFTDTENSSDITFTTLPPVKPTVKIMAVQGVSGCACGSLQAGFGFGGLPTTVHVEYGSTRRLGLKTGTKSFPAWMDVDGQGLAQNFDIPANNRLKAGRKYYFRVVAVNRVGRTLSPIQSFTIPTHA